MHVIVTFCEEGPPEGCRMQSHAEEACSKEKGNNNLPVMIAPRAPVGGSAIRHMLVVDLTA